MMPSLYQVKYYKTLTQLKEHCYYLQEYIVDYETIDFRIDIVMAVASSSAIGGWVIWNTTPMNYVWAGIIAGSQVINAIKHLLPFKKKISLLHPFKQELDLLSLKAEKAWFKVAEGILSEEEIHSLTMELKSDKTKIEQKHLKNNVLKDNVKLLANAKNKTAIWINNNFM